MTFSAYQETPRRTPTHSLRNPGLIPVQENCEECMSIGKAIIEYRKEKTLRA